jgi:DNA-binding GntR family transcriptional regulator
MSVDVRDVFSPVQQGNLKDVVYAKIRAAILGGQIPAGTRLLEAELSQRMQVSRAPVREALVHLEQDGLVVSRPNRGSYVAEIFSQQDVNEITTLRSTLEGMAIAIATARISDEELDELAVLVVEMQRAADENDLALLADIDYQFHNRIMNAAGHNRLYQTWSMLATHYWALYLTTLQRMDPRTPNHLGGVYGKHMPIVDAMRARQADLATMFLHRNILDGLQLQLMEEPAPYGGGSRRPDGLVLDADE